KTAPSSSTSPPISGGSKVVVHAKAEAYAKIASSNVAGARFQDANTAWIKNDTLIALSPLSNDSTWRSNVDRLLEFCRTKGWLSPDGLEVQGHVEWNG
ncbi:MAG TPA: hypothetical protein VFT26_01280, partial [Pyrinomonadaceae bacterium]|nr:hypothetical protein [Pyrinomonadaceae bacterium]